MRASHQTLVPRELHQTVQQDRVLHPHRPACSAFAQAMRAGTTITFYPLKKDDFRQGFDEVLSEAVGVSALGRHHQDIADFDSRPPVAISPDIVGGA